MHTVHDLLVIRRGTHNCSIKARAEVPDHLREKVGSDYVTVMRMK